MAVQKAKSSTMRIDLIPEISDVPLSAHPKQIIGHDINQRALHIAAHRAELHGVHVDLLQPANQTRRLMGDVHDEHLEDRRATVIANATAVRANLFRCLRRSVEGLDLSGRQA